MPQPIISPIPGRAGRSPERRSVRLIERERAVASSLERKPARARLLRTLAALGSASWLALAPGCDRGTSAPDAAPGGTVRDAAASDDGDGGTWSALPDVIDGPIQETAVVALEGRIYVIGGFDDQGTIVTDVRVYDVAARQWTQASPLPMPVHHANAAAAHGRVYVLGALTGTGFDQIGNVWSYDPASDTWTDAAPMEAAFARGSSAVGVIGGRIHLAGGYRNGDAVTTHSVYDPVDDAWDHSLAPLPEPRDHLVGAAVGGLFYVIGGRDHAIHAITERVEAYDPATDAWTLRAPMRTGRAGMAAGVVHGRILVVGGEGDPGSPFGVFPQTESYDPDADAWTALAPMATPRHGMGAAGHDGALYVPGGATRQGFGAVATFDSFTPP